MNFDFFTFDPRPVDAAKRSNEEIFANGPVFGIEVTVPALAERCVVNIDPQHTDGDSKTAAIEAVALMKKSDLPQGGSLATVRADLDSIGAMAIVVLRSERVRLNSFQNRIELVAKSDKFSQGGWPGFRILPTVENPFDDSTASAESNSQLGPMAKAVSDFRIPLKTRVEWMKEWLLTGKEPEGYREQFVAERLEIVKAIENGTIKTREEISWCHRCQAFFWSGGKPMECPNCFVSGDTIPWVAVVNSTHRAATQIGYYSAPVVIAYNPEFRFQGGDPHAKFTICQFTDGYVDFEGLKTDLNDMEAGWGGSPTIIGSPQGVSSKLTVKQVSEIVWKHLK